MINVAGRPLHIAVVGPSRFGIAQPFAGGLEAHTAGLVRALHQRGHRLSVVAGPEGQPQQLPVEVSPVVSRRFDHEFSGRRDTTHPNGYCRHESDRYRSVTEALVRRPDVDVVHNNSLHPAVVDADPGDGSFVHILHCPPFPKLVAAHRRLAARTAHRNVIAVSRALADMWHGVATGVVHNGVDPDTWYADSGLARRHAVWAGRLVEEKAPHLAIRAAKLAGVPIRLAGPIGDERYFDRYISHELDESVRWLGPLVATELADLFRSSAVGVVSPMWDEPFCLVAAEMLACGTPVAAFDRGGLNEFVAPHVGALATAGDAVSLADAIGRATDLAPSHCAAHARSTLSSTVMVERYEAIYRRAAERPGWERDSHVASEQATA